MTTSDGRLAFRPSHGPATGAAPTGLVEVGTAGGLGYVPAGGEGPLRLVLLLHGAGGTARMGVDLMRAVADEHRLLLVAPQSAGRTWDALTGGYGPDIRRLDALLDEAAGRYPVEGFTVGGFSDGGSYAVSVGMANGDVFDSVVAFAPCFAAPQARNGRPRIYVAHGVRDTVLPVDHCSRRLVPRLRAEGYPVTYEEFDGPHVVPPEIARRAAEWLTTASA